MKSHIIWGYIFLNEIKNLRLCNVTGKTLLFKVEVFLLRLELIYTK